MNAVQSGLAARSLRAHGAPTMPNPPESDPDEPPSRKPRRERVLRQASVEELRRFGENLRARRQTLGLSQDRVAAMAGLDQKAVSDVEVGERNATFDVLQRLAQAVGCTVGLLLNCPPE